MKSKVLITGGDGQTGSYLAEIFLSKKWDVIIGYRRSATKKFTNLLHIAQDVELCPMDVSDPHSVNDIVGSTKPDILINCAANSFVGTSWNSPLQVLDVNTGGVVNCLESIKNLSPKTRFLNFGTSEEFGNISFSPQDETHPLNPRSPYGASKAAARHFVKVYRESYGLWACQPWCFNHESMRRGGEFVTTKIIKGLLDFKVSGIPFDLGNLEAKRDWSHAKDIAWAVFTILNQATPLDVVVGSGESHSVRDFVQAAAKKIDLELKSVFDEVNPSLLCPKVPKYVCDDRVVINSSLEFYRPAEVDELTADNTKIKSLGWEPSYNFEDLVNEMVNATIKSYG